MITLTLSLTLNHHVVNLSYPCLTLKLNPKPSSVIFYKDDFIKNFHKITIPLIVLSSFDS